MSIINSRENLDELLLKCVELNGTDLRFSVGAYPAVRIDGEVEYMKTDDIITTEDVENIADYVMPEGRTKRSADCYNCTFPYSIESKGRFRVNLFRQRSSFSASFRAGNFYCPTKELLRLPTEIDNVFNIESGLIIISGSRGSGRTTTSAYILDTIRQEKAYFIDTVEDPIEFLFKHDKSVINQMEVGIDVPTILDGMKIAIRNYPDVIFVSSFMDKEVIQLALEAAREGKIVIAATKVQGVTEVIKNIMDIFPSESSNYIRTLLADSLKCIISQQLIPDSNSDNIPLCEILFGIKAVSNIIKENKISQLHKIMEASHAKGMLSIDNHLLKLLNRGYITMDTAKDYSENWEVLSQKAVNKMSGKHA